jgi:hypothetical protein
LGDFDETGSKKGHDVEMCILYGLSCPIIFQGVSAPGLSISFEKYFVFTILPKPFGGF